jgi:leader peptidase (prepilin peptidase)/N-methyltransferase
MGFGDVTFMAMIGAFVGWQPALLAFALAPFAGVAVGMVTFFLGYGAAIPFGPFLAAATVTVVLLWCGIWLQTEWFFSLGLPLVLVVLLVCLVLIGIMLAIWYQIKIRLYHLHNGRGKRL